ncbi:MAG: sodium:solute symporter [Imperialibacter sp.]|uniref:sodium:solute symporter n=1 Tax=Imperialibacter sp. TaxID=2038411 RepID=UPI0032ED5DCB
MSNIDLIVLLGTLAFIVGYGTLKYKSHTNIDGYLLGDKSFKWGTIGLSVMATQASAITFISTPGQAYESGMGFVQNYFGLPLALIIVSAVFIPIYYKLKVFTAYEFLEKRFDLKTRLLGAFLFLLQRGLAAGITIYAPAIIISTVLHWDLSYTIMLVGGLVVLYTVSGGSKAVSITQKQQMAVIMIGMFVAFGILIYLITERVSFSDALSLAGSLGKLEVVNFSFDSDVRYTFWTGITGGLFLQMSYFGTDQSQVSRYLSGKNVAESRMGLMFNAILKIPMQFFILFVGVMVFIFYQYNLPPVHFKVSNVEMIEGSAKANEYLALEAKHREVFDQKLEAITDLQTARIANNETAIKSNEALVIQYQAETEKTRQEVKNLLTSVDASTETKDSDYIFLSFILEYLPVGVIGLLLAVIFSAAMSSTASELNALASTTTVDFYMRLVKKDGAEKHFVHASKFFTAFWGLVAIGFALFANLVENLIEAVNILGSIFYGSILGIFLVAFFIKVIKGPAVFWAAVISQLVVIVLFKTTDIAYLWYNVIGCVGVIALAFVINTAIKKD